MNKKIKQKIIKFLENKNLIFEENKIIVEKSRNFGDYSSNIALIFAKKNKIEPLNLAKEIKDFLLLEDLDLEK